MESDGGSEPEIDVSEDSCSSDSDIDPPPPNPEPRRKKTRKEPTESPTAAVREESGRDGTIWIETSNESAPGRYPLQNILTEAAGPTTQAKSRIGCALDSFLCLCDMEMLQNIRDCTVIHARREGPVTWDMSVD
ncbi:hypothetical protein DPEC_G00236770 [Dallia pectoralis]|uniref:Uncharacterized protein n=1 Tax=Dallia pectoralis TaxID=75939 RepID=A0ACC2FYR4_DALPE|nr:hypothetical protein DPEC_G00236770 [Dallia pectoralis]